MSSFSQTDYYTNWLSELVGRSEPYGFALIARNDSDALRDLLTHYPEEIKKTNAKGETLLVAAAKGGSSDIMKLLLPLHKEANKNALLAMAVEANNLQAVEGLWSYPLPDPYATQSFQGERIASYDYVARKGSPEMAVLFAQKTQFDKKRIYSFLHTAFDTENYAAALKIAEAGIDINGKKLGRTPLERALQAGQKDIAQAIIRQDYFSFDSIKDLPTLIEDKDINQALTDSGHLKPYHVTPILSQALKKGDLQKAQKLLDAGVDIHCYEWYNANYHIALLPKESLLFLANNHFVPNRDHPSLAHLLLEKGYLEHIPYLIEQRVDHTIKNHAGERLIDVAIKDMRTKDRAALIKTLIDHGANITEPVQQAGTDARQSVLEKIFQRHYGDESNFPQNTDIIHHLVDTGWKDEAGNSLKHWALSHSSQVHDSYLTAALLRPPIDWEAKNRDGQSLADLLKHPDNHSIRRELAKSGHGTPLLSIYARDIPANRDAITQLLAAGAMPERKDTLDLLAFHIEKERHFVFGEPSFAQLLSNPSPEEQASLNTLFLKTAQYGKALYEPLLVQMGADIHTTTSEGENALHLAARNQDTATCARLLALGIDPAAKNRQGQTPADMTNDAELKRFLASAGKERSERIDLLLQMAAPDAINVSHIPLQPNDCSYVTNEQPVLSSPGAPSITVATIEPPSGHQEMTTYAALCSRALAGNRARGSVVAYGAELPHASVASPTYDNKKMPEGWLNHPAIASGKIVFSASYGEYPLNPDSTHIKNNLAELIESRRRPEQERMETLFQQTKPIVFQGVGNCREASKEMQCAYAQFRQDNQEFSHGPRTVSVGAVGRENGTWVVKKFSQYNPFIIAPLPDKSINGIGIGGTSGSTPAEAGLYAELGERHPGRSYEDIMFALAKTADKDIYYYDNQSLEKVAFTPNAAGLSFSREAGVGIINFNKADALLTEMDKAVAQKPTAAIDYMETVTTTTDGIMPQPSGRDAGKYVYQLTIPTSADGQPNQAGRIRKLVADTRFAEGETGTVTLRSPRGTETTLTRSLSGWSSVYSLLGEEFKPGEQFTIVTDKPLKHTDISIHGFNTDSIITQFLVNNSQIPVRHADADIAIPKLPETIRYEPNATPNNTALSKPALNISKPQTSPTSPRPN